MICSRFLSLIDLILSGGFGVMTMSATQLISDSIVVVPYAVTVIPIVGIVPIRVGIVGAVVVIILPPLNNNISN